MTKSQIERSQNLNSIQLIFEIIIIFLFVLNILIGFFTFFEFVYFINFLITTVILALAIANLVFSIISKNQTLPFTVTNIVMAVLTFIPVVGFFSAITGIVISSISILKIVFAQKVLQKESTHSQVVEVEASVVDKLD
jgi:hypothetical protein